MISKQLPLGLTAALAFFRNESLCASSVGPTSNNYPWAELAEQLRTEAKLKQVKKDLNLSEVYSSVNYAMHGGLFRCDVEVRRRAVITIERFMQGKVMAEQYLYEVERSYGGRQNGGYTTVAWFDKQEEAEAFLDAMPTSGYIQRHTRPRLSWGPGLTAGIIKNKTVDKPDEEWQSEWASYPTFTDKIPGHVLWQQHVMDFSNEKYYLPIVNGDVASHRGKQAWVLHIGVQKENPYLGAHVYCYVDEFRRGGMDDWLHFHSYIGNVSGYVERFFPDYLEVSQCHLKYDEAIFNKVLAMCEASTTERLTLPVIAKSKTLQS